MKSTAKSLLVVEDSKELLEIWRILFRSSGYRARFCLTCSDALRELSSGYRPDVLITDYYLPDMTGLDLIEKAKSMFEAMQCILLTGNTDKSFIEQIKNRGDVSLLIKPVPFRHLKESVEALVQSKMPPVL